jgi:biopolymer transport protein ExbD
MASFSSPDGAPDNPVPVNVTAMVDVIFCLSIFFMCAFHFRQLEGKMDSWLPSDGGVKDAPLNPVQLEEVRISLRYLPDAADPASTVRRQVGPRAVRTDEELRDALRSLLSSYAKAGVADVRAVIDSDPFVPWSMVVAALSLCREEGLRNIAFAAPRG